MLVFIKYDYSSITVKLTSDGISMHDLVSVLISKALLIKLCTRSALSRDIWAIITEKMVKGKFII